MMAPAPFENLKAHHYGVVLADPPWNFGTWSHRGEGRSATQHYKTLTLDELGRLPVAALAAQNAFLFMWTTGPHLPQALHLLDRWGFTYSGFGFVWVKTNPREADALMLDPRHSFHVGCGYGTRHNVELCLLGRRGNPKRLRRDVRELIIAPRRQHSRKPDESYERIERLADGHRVELFSRQRRRGWTPWGDEVDKFDPVTPRLSLPADLDRDRKAIN